VSRWPQLILFSLDDEALFVDCVCSGHCHPYLRDPASDSSRFLGGPDSAVGAKLSLDFRLVVALVACAEVALADLPIGTQLSRFAIARLVSLRWRAFRISCATLVLMATPNHLTR
jgi:hypothetical protein